mgnify:CR=1 FL=1
MELFMRNAGTRMPTERLMLEVWGEDAPEGANVVWGLHLVPAQKSWRRWVPMWPSARRATRDIRLRLSRKASRRERAHVV